MSVTVIFRSKGEHTRLVEEFLHDFEKWTGRTLNTIDPDTREGIAICQLYDIVQYPSIVATDTDGTMRNMWQGLPMPTIDEVSAYV